MKTYSQMTKEELTALQSQLKEQYEEIKAKNLSLDMSRGKPGKEQIDMCNDMLHIVETGADCIYEGTDCRNYGGLDGLGKMKQIFADILELQPENIIIGGNSSLTLMYDSVARAFTHGVLGGEKPWSQEKGLKWLCVVPGYDRHFAITEFFGFELINIPMLATGPDMDMVEKLVSEDEKIKGIWCVPKYSNPDGIVYSDETIKRLAALKPKAKDFRIFYDNAYVVHHLTVEEVSIPNIFEYAKECGNENMIFEFASTSKYCFPGAGVSCIAASKENIDFIKKQIFFQTIGPDKMNQLRHIKYFGNVDGIKAHMRKQAAILKPRFDIVINTLNSELSGLGVGDWIEPKGGYFVSFNTLEGCAKRTVTLAKEAGITLTGAGATYPYKKDPEDKNIRISPSFPSCADLQAAMDVFCVCVKIASVEKLLAQ